MSPELPPFPEIPTNLLVGDRLSADAVRFGLKCLAGIWGCLIMLNDLLERVAEGDEEAEDEL